MTEAEEDLSSHYQVYVEDMEQRISIVREQLQYLLAESAESDEE